VNGIDLFSTHQFLVGFCNPELLYKSQTRFPQALQGIYARHFLGDERSVIFDPL